VQSEAAYGENPREEECDSGSAGEASPDQNFRELFRERLEAD